MTQTNLFDHIDSSDEPKRFVAKIFSVENLWHGKVIDGIDIIKRQNFYVIEDTEEQTIKSIKTLLIKSEYRGKIGFELPTKRERRGYPTFLYSNLMVQILDTHIDSVWSLEKKLNNGNWFATGAVPVNDKYETQTIETEVRKIKLYNCIEGLAVYKAKREQNAK